MMARSSRTATSDNRPTDTTEYAPGHVERRHPRPGSGTAPTDPMSLIDPVSSIDAVSPVDAMSPLGRCATALGVICTTGFTLAGWHELLAMALVLATMLCIGMVLSLGSLRLRATVDVSRRRAVPDDTIAVRLTLSNPGTHPTSSASGLLPIGSTLNRVAIPSLAGGQSRLVTFNITTRQRAVWQIGPLFIHRGDPFGLIRRQRRLTSATTIYVHPPTTAATLPETGSKRNLEGCPQDRIVNDDLDFHGLRDYTPGDDMRHVHWASTAKTGTPMIRQYQATIRTDTALTLDTCADSYATAEEFELAVSVYASIGLRCIQQGNPLVASAGDTAIDHSNAMTFLDWCSAIEPVQCDDSSAPDKHHRAWHHANGAALHMVIVGSLTEMADMERMTATTQSHTTTVVFRIQTEARRRIRSLPHFTLATVGKLADLPQLMEALT